MKKRLCKNCEENKSDCTCKNCREGFNSDCLCKEVALNINNSHGGKRPNSGRKTNYASMEVKLPKEDKAALKVKYGRSFNQVFRDWVKSLLS